MSRIGISMVSSLSKVLTTVAALLFTTSAFAQDSVAEGRALWQGGAGCYNCHGTFGQGGEGGHFPAGPSLRATLLDAETLKTIVQCGIPGTQMPFNLTGAYIEHDCYGYLGEMAEGVLPGAALDPAQIDALVAYIGENILGKRRVTKKECIAYYEDENAPACFDFR